MKNFIKLLMLLIFCSQYSNAYAPHKPTECSLSRYTGNNTKCVKLVYNEVNERLDRSYKEILKNIPRIGDIEVVQEYISLLKEKNEICGKNPKNKIKADCEIEEERGYEPNDETLDCEVAKADFCNFYEYYGYTLKNIPEFTVEAISNKHNLWLKSKNEFCEKYSNDEIKLKSCHIDYSIPKLNELWDIEEILSEHPFEGKWADCEYDNRDVNLTCRTYFRVEQDDNVCGGDWYRANPDDRHIVMLLYDKIANRLRDVKICYSKDADGGCDVLEDGYDKQGRMTYKTTVPFSEWEKFDDGIYGRSGQYFNNERSLSTGIKTPFLPNEREELIQTYKWLQDCLNYKGK
ncbi:MAG: hypothetical protein LBG21_02275 [Campylobacteraceae bacterium]|nr:hypothetical protein [Campylobacteraceae bacterium]